MSIESFFTTQNQTPQSNITLGTPADSSIGLQGLSFIDMILTNIIEQQEETEAKAENGDTESLDVDAIIGETKGETAPLQSDKPALDEGPSLDPAVLLSDNPEITEEVESYSLDTQDKIETTITLNKEAFDKLLPGDDHITGGIYVDPSLALEPVDTPEEYPKILEAFFPGDKDHSSKSSDRLSTLLGSLEKLEGKNLQLSNLTPAELDALISNLEDLPESELNSLMIGLIQLLPPQEQQNVIITQSSLIIASGPLSGEQINQLKPANDVASRLNALLVMKTEAREGYQAGTGIDALPTDSELDNFEHLLKQFTSNEKSDNGNAQGQSKEPGATPNLSVLQGLPFTMNGSLYLTSSMSFGIDEYGGGAVITNTAQYSNLITQAQSANQAHPGTQAVAATISKSAAKGKDQNVTIRLDPPELGRVEVRMTFSKGKAQKATILSEKPETHLMLQRDAQILERTLQESGLNNDSSGLNFELADDQHNFSHNGGHDGQGPMGRNHDGQDNQEDLIETTMTWNVDPGTGHTSYNILV